MLSACGLNLTMSGTVQTLRTALTTSSASAARMPNARPPCSTLGQLMFSSIKSTPAAQSICTPSTFSSIVWPPRFAQTVVPHRRMAGSSWSMKVLHTGVLQADGVHQARGRLVAGARPRCRAGRSGSAPCRRCRPARADPQCPRTRGRSRRCREAAMTGPASRLPRKSTCRSAISQTPPVR